jgi:flagellar basal body-associated protein FliL
VYHIGGGIGLLDTPQGSVSKIEGLDVSGVIYASTFSHDSVDGRRASVYDSEYETEWVADVRHIGGVIGNANYYSEGLLEMRDTEASFFVEAPDDDKLITSKGRSMQGIDREEIHESQEYKDTVEAFREGFEQAPVRASVRAGVEERPDGLELIPVYVVLPVITIMASAAIGYGVIYLSIAFVADAVIEAMTSLQALIALIGLIVVVITVILIVVAVVVLSMMFMYWGFSKPKWESHVHVGGAIGSEGRAGITIENVHTAVDVVSGEGVFSNMEHAGRVSDSKNYQPLKAMIIRQPEDVDTSVMGEKAVLRVEAEGHEVKEEDEKYTYLEYQWYYDEEDDNSKGKEIEGATKETLEITVDYIGKRYYYCVVSNVTVRTKWSSRTVTAYVGSKETRPPEPGITEQPRDASTIINLPAKLSVKGGVGVGTVYYQWFVNDVKSTEEGIAILGATESELRAVQRESGEYYYYVALTNMIGEYSNAIYSDVVKLTVEAKSVEPVITVEPQSGYAMTNVYTSLSVRADIAEANGVLSYQWYQSFTGSRENGRIIEGETGETINIKSETYGIGQYYVEVTNTVRDEQGRSDSKSVTSEIAKINYIEPVIEMPTIEKQPTREMELRVGALGGTRIGVMVSGGAGLTYQWYKSQGDSNINGEKLIGQTQTSMELDTREQGTYYYYCVVTSKDMYGNQAEVASEVSKVSVVDEKLAIDIQTGGEVEKGYIEYRASIVSQPKRMGAVSYQWYESSNADGREARAIRRGWGSVLRVSTEEAKDSKGKYKYYFVAINATTKSSHESAVSRIENSQDMIGQKDKAQVGMYIGIAMVVVMIGLGVAAVYMINTTKKKRMSRVSNQNNYKRIH